MALVGGFAEALRFENLNPLCDTKTQWKSPAWICRIASTADLDVTQARFDGAVRSGEEALAAGDYERALDLVATARELPGYQVSREALDLKNRIGLCCRRRTIHSAWCARTFRADSEAMRSVSISSDGSFAVSGGKDGLMRVWSLSTGECLQEWEAHSGGVNSVFISSDNRLALSGGYDKRLCLFDLMAARCAQQFEEHKPLNLDGLPAQSDVSAAIESLARRPGGHNGWISSACLSPDNYWVLSGSEDKSLRLWEAATGRCIRTFHDHTHWVNSVYMSCDGRLAVSGGVDRVVRLWDVATRIPLRIFTGHTHWIDCVALTADNRVALSGGRDNTVRLWDVATGELIRIIKGHSGSVTAIHLCADDRFALTGSADLTLRLWELATGRCIRTLEGHGAAVTAVSMSRDSRWVISGSADGTIRLWELDWDFEIPDPSNWRQAIEPHLLNFLTAHTPYAASLPESIELSEQEIRLALTRRGPPSWRQDEIPKLLQELATDGLGWIRREDVLTELAAIAHNWNRPPIGFGFQHEKPFAEVVGRFIKSLETSLTEGGIAPSVRPERLHALLHEVAALIPRIGRCEADNNGDLTFKDCKNGTAAEQEGLFKAFTRRFPESAWVATGYLSPMLKDSHIELPDGTETADFNRYSVQRFFGIPTTEQADQFVIEVWTAEASAYFL